MPKILKCLICQNPNANGEYKNICQGCITLIKHADNCCQKCAATLPKTQKKQQQLCGNCQKIKPAYDRVHYAALYQEPINHWVMQLKFGNNTLISRLFAELMLKQLKNTSQEYQLMPVPLHKNRLRKRGYNQAYEIAKEMAKSSNFKLNTALKRHKNTAMQAELKLKQRAKNVKNAFQVQGTITTKNILLVDDVMTSGNTLQECAKTLRKVGIKNIQVIVFARKSLN